MEALILRAALSGILLAITAAPMGCFMMWQNMAFYGAAIAHASILGLAIAVVFGFSPQVGLLAASIVFAMLIAVLQRLSPQSLDTQLSIVSHSLLAMGLILIGLYAPAQVDLMQYLFGDILSISNTGLFFIAGFGTLICALFAVYLKPLLLCTISPDLAQAEGLPLLRINSLFLVALAVFVGVAIQVVGLLLVMSILIIPPATSKAFARTPQAMIMIAALIGSLCVLLGLGVSWFYDVATGPAIIVSAFILYLLSLLKQLLTKSKGNRPHSSS